MKNVTIKNVLLSLTTVLAVACGTSNKTTAGNEKSAALSTHNTFRVDMKTAPGSIISKNASLVRSSAINEMTRKGFAESAGSTDWVVNIVTLVKSTETAAINTNQFSGFSSLRDQIYWGQYKSTPKATKNTDFSLMIAIADAATSKNVWQGLANVELAGASVNTERVIDSTVTAMLAGFSSPVAKR